MEIPGLALSHQIITDECRTNRGDAGAFEEAVQRIRDRYDWCAERSPAGRGVKLRLVLLVERPR